MFTDIAVNLNSSQFNADRDDIVVRASQAGITRLINLASDLDEARSCIEQASCYPGVYATAGVHPHQASRWESGSTKQLRQLISEPKVIAIGECGLDYCRNYSPRPSQLMAFESQLALASELNFPLILHCREAYLDFLPLVEKYKSSNAVLHCFTGSKAELTAALELGLYIGITGWICDPKRGQELRQLVSLIPDDKLLLETDSPYLLPKNISPKPKSRRNEPANLTHIAQTVTELRGQTLEQLTKNCENNIRRLFPLT